MSVLLLCSVFNHAYAKEDIIKVRDIAFLENIRTNQLIGYGVVSGLEGTGDSNSSLTNDSTNNLLKSLGINIPVGNNSFKNVAVVTLTSEIPAFAKVGQKLDVTVSSIGSAKSLKSGVLMLTQLKGVDGQVYALAQGNVVISDNKGTQLMGQIINGATLEKEVMTDLAPMKTMKLSLKNADFEMSQKVSALIQSKLNIKVKAMDARTLEIDMPENVSEKVSLLANVMSLTVENKEVVETIKPKVMINTKTNTVIATQGIEVGNCQISFGTFTLNVNKSVKMNNSKNAAIAEIQKTSLTDILSALRSIGATTQDLINVIQTLKASNHINADIEFI